MKQKKDHTTPLRSIEHFNHFRCGVCNGWWGIGDAPQTRQKWFCPWCGSQNTYTQITKTKIDLS